MFGNVIQEKEDYLASIDEKRSEMIKIAETEGLTGGLTIKASQELDHLLNAYRRYLRKKTYDTIS
ncbi:aspartyl-phosphate phosphatase Spo0E family protein [Aureibacillus halotolerans]|uniref:Spo0E like sporulation regulatory protein n=1 Tax=Aureibacillus halotolerans TaxID=1508390 RepID=A0A4R6TTV6_9BACI|nr:aspartyl-phosphate phosphatase Spo0E family protein [Aureibacillus halotolerans]TDQ36751.1 Spo0E like sporulation regulatory protein [Aureibacillus halotolerans]